MSADVVNLRRARKAKHRIEKQQQAEANRLAFGEPGAAKAQRIKERKRADRAIEAHSLRKR